MSRVDYGRLTSPIHIIVNVSKYGVGKYTIYWDNTFSLITSKYVGVREAVYSKTLDTTEKDFYEFVGFVLGLIGFVGLLGPSEKGLLWKLMVMWFRLTTRVEGIILNSRLRKK
ncbi:hypothetical protein [Thermococcus sp. 2319x1]|uniref:hypothetical protein n=1 Tax=Thermococcus sp. 2319x1 TaxID=1674923 RepID=UPI0011874BC5|nr:hypothetical protein [Thermococcus sp. 2319x1]